MFTIEELLTELLSIPSPTGDTKKAIGFVESVFSRLGISYYYTNKGALVATIKGQDSEKALCFSAHIDTLGAMVRGIKDNGRLRITQIGNYSWATIEGEEVIISAENGKSYTGTVLIDKASKHVFNEESDERPRTEENMEIRVDEKVFTKEDTLALGIRPGDYVYFKPAVTITPSGFVKSRHLDDKACVAVMLDMMQQLKDEALPQDVHFFISNYEEVGHGSSAGIPDNTTTLLALDMAAIGDDLSGDELHTTICAKDSTGPYDLEVRKHLVALAKEHQIPYVTDIYPFYGSDASAALAAGGNFKTGLIGPGVDASHNKERTHLEAIDATLRLALAFARNPI